MPVIDFTLIDETIEAIVKTLVKQTMELSGLKNEIWSNASRVTLFLNNQHTFCLNPKTGVEGLTKLYSAFEPELWLLLFDDCDFTSKNIRVVVEVNGVVTSDVRTNIRVVSSTYDEYHTSAGVDISILKGKVISSIHTDTNEIDDYDQLCADESITFICTDGTELTMQHTKDCCENVTVEDICGDLRDLIGQTIVTAEVVINSSTDDIVTSEDKPVNSFLPVYPVAHTMSDYSETWTFYKLDCIKGSVVIRWLGESNGYYSESVDLLVKVPRGRGANKMIA